MFKIFLTLFMMSAFASEEADKLMQATTIAVNQKIETHDTGFINLPHLMMQGRVVIRMKRTSFCFCTTLVNVSFEGSDRQEIKIESGDYINYIAKSNTPARAIEIKNMEGCNVTVESVTLLPRTFKPHSDSRYGGENAGNSYGAVSYAYQAFKYLEDWVSDQDRIAYLTPSIKVLGQAMAVLNVSPETSSSAREALSAVAKQLALDAPFIEKLISVETTYAIGVEITSVKSQIESMLK